MEEFRLPEKPEDVLALLGSRFHAHLFESPQDKCVARTIDVEKDVVFPGETLLHDEPQLKVACWEEAQPLHGPKPWGEEKKIVRFTQVVVIGGMRAMPYGGDDWFEAEADGEVRVSIFQDISGVHRSEIMHVWPYVMRWMFVHEGVLQV